jgi:periplasmic divalent cation tolerance protein
MNQAGQGDTVQDERTEVVVLVTTASEEEAARIARSVVEAGLAACANIVPRIRSIYRWEGKVTDEQETLMLLKSRLELFPSLQEEIKRLHSYAVPEIIALPIRKGLNQYLQWIHEETRKPLRP